MDMLWKTSDLNGLTISASDGEIGSVSDILFDDRSWAIQWLVVDTGRWFPATKVVRLPTAYKLFEAKRKSLSTSLTLAQFEQAPVLNTYPPVSRQKRQASMSSYEFQAYRLVPFGMPPVTPVVADLAETALAQNHTHYGTETFGDPHLRSAHEVVGYHLNADDGEIGKVDDFLADTGDWHIRFIVVETGSWWNGQKVFLKSEHAASIHWAAGKLAVKLTREEVKAATNK